MRIYNEPISDVVQDEHGRPVSWTWRGRAYTSDGSPLEFWATTPEWWLEENPDLDANPETRHWVLEATSSQGRGQVEIAHQLHGNRFVLTRIHD